MEKSELDKKIKIFTIGDHPLSSSGVGTQSRYMIEGLLKTEKYQFISYNGLRNNHLSKLSKNNSSR